MAEAQINELFEEAIGRCEELADEAQGAGDAVESLVDSAEELVERFTAEAEEARRGVLDLTQGLDEAEHSLAATVEQATGGLAALAAKAAAVGSAAGDVMARTREALAELDSLRDDLRQRLEGRARDAAAGVQQLSDRVSTLQAEIAKGLEAAAAQVEELTTAVGEAQEEWGERLQALMDAVGSLESGVAEATEKYAAEIEDVLDHERVDLLVQRLSNEMLITTHNEAIGLLGRRFEHELPDGMAEKLEPLAAAVTALDSRCVQGQGALEQCVDAAAARVAKAGEALALMTPVLDSAQRIGA